MPIISFIPKSYKDGFELLATQQDETFTAIQEALYEVSLSSSTEKLASKVAKLKKIDYDEVEKIFLSVGGLISFLESDENIEEITSDLIALGENVLIPPDKIPQFQIRLISLLKNKKIFYASKARDLITETENLFLTCRVVSDIRPVFNINVDDSPEAGIIMHSLHIHYQGKLTAQHQDIYLSLDSNDIAFLIETLIRADKKDDSLKALLTKWGMKNLND